MKISKRVRHGLIVMQSRNGWIVPYNGKGTPLGVWTDSHENVYRLPDGTVKRLVVPAGIQIKGSGAVQCKPMATGKMWV